MIKKNIPGIIFWLVLILLLASCSSVTASTPILIGETPIKVATMVPDFYEVNCQSLSVSSTLDPSEESLFPPASLSDHIRGAQDADVTIIEYGDFQCPGCAVLAPEFLKLLEIFPNELRIVFRQMPLYDIHDKAFAAAQASEAASDEGKFWEMHDLLYENYESWISLTPEDFNEWLVEQAATIGLDQISFQKKFTSPEISDRIQKALKNALGIGLRTTPFLLINGQIYNGPSDFHSMSQIIHLIVLGNRQFSSCPEMIIDPQKQYIATLQTEKGDIILQLFPEKAPFTVNSFVFLAQNGWYDNITFHKVVQGLAQTGDPSGTGLGGPGYLFEDEQMGSMNFDQPGVVAMLNSGMDTNGSQFFITTNPYEELNGRYTIFGQVISGLDVINKLTLRDPDANPDLPPGDLLIKVTVVEK